MRELVFDTSPLQAVWRSGLFEILVREFAAVVPRAVADETRHFVRGARGAGNPRTKAERLRLAPDLDADGRIQDIDIARHHVDEAMRNFFGHHGATVAQYKGDVYAWADRSSAKIGVPEMEVIALAAARNAVAVLDDHKGLRAADANEVHTATTRELLDALVVHDGSIDLAVALQRIAATRYEATTRRSVRPAFTRHAAR